MVLIFASLRKLWAMCCVSLRASDLCVTVKITKDHLVKSQDLDFNLLTACLEVPFSIHSYPGRSADSISFHWV